MAAKKTQPSTTNVLVINVPAWVNTTTKRKNNSSFIFRPQGESKYFLHGEEISEEEFLNIFSISQLDQNINQFGDRKDGRQL
jgi:hypothetical protein